ncbi:hypothetical protein F5Y19DRAFT_473599 [Xylariaceae sp. FL1651]|nr:hypothetical protein F5Y19DRAFT_473599 [Xylariaceae sp. FL1651]
MASGLLLTAALIVNLFSIIVLSVLLSHGVDYIQVPTLNSREFSGENCIYTETLRHCDFDTSILGLNARTIVLAAGSALLGVIVHTGLYVSEFSLRSSSDSRMYPLLSACIRPIFGKRRPGLAEAAQLTWTSSSIITLSVVMSAKGYAAQVQQYDEFVDFDIEQLRQYFTRSAFVNVRMNDIKSPRPLEWLVEMGFYHNRVGDTLYPEPRTYGIGINAASLSRYALVTQPLPDRMHKLPPGHGFQNLEARLYGTEVVAECELITQKCNVTYAQGEFTPTNGPSTAKPALYEYELSCPIPGMEPLLMIQDQSQPFGVRHQLIRNPENAHESPLHLFAIHDVAYSKRMDWWHQRPTVVKCYYQGYNILADIQITSFSKPFRIIRDMEQKDELTAVDLWPMIQNISSIVGPNARGFATALDAFTGGPNSVLQETYVKLLSKVLTETGQAYWSLKRQYAEVVGWSDHFPRSGDSVRKGIMRTTYTRVGGGGWLWVAVLATLLGLCAMALLRSLAAFFLLLKTADPEWLLLSQTEDTEETGVGALLSDGENDEPHPQHDQLSHGGA